MTTYICIANGSIIWIVFLESDDGAKDKNKYGDTETDAAKKTNPNGDIDEFPNEASTTINEN